MLYKNGKREIGVVVDRVRIEKLEDFGTPAFVGDKVVASERERENTSCAAQISARNSGAQFVDGPSSAPHSAGTLTSSTRT